MKDILDLQVLHDIRVALLRIMQSEGTSAHTSYIDEVDYVDAPEGKCYRITINLELVDEGDRT